MNHAIRWALCCAMALTLAACGSDDDSPASSSPLSNTTNPAYPTAVDSFDAAGNTNVTAAGATLITVGTTYALNIFPQGDVDFVKVALVAGTEYEFSVNKICATCDVRIYLYDTDGVTAIADDDDYIDLDSAVVYTPGVSGTYFLKISAYNNTYGINSYQLNVHPFVDADGDDYSTYYDCNDSDDSIYPGATEIPDDGIDQDCSGGDLPLGTTADSFEPDNNAASAKSLTLSNYGFYEALYILNLVPNSRFHTIHEGSDEDWLKVIVPPKQAYEFNSHYYGSISYDIYESDATTLLGSSLMKNTTASPKTFYINVTGNAGDLYVPYLIDYGVDKDGDGFYTMDWSDERDCNDNNAAINPDATEIVGDGIDQDCEYGNDDPVI